MPMKMPPKKENRNSTVALTRENVPVTAAASANWKATMPDASLMSDSPSRMLLARGEMSVSLESEATATASVGPRAAPRAKAAAKLMEGTTQLTAKPTTRAVTTTSPMASETTGLLLRQSAALSTLFASS